MFILRKPHIANRTERIIEKETIYIGWVPPSSHPLRGPRGVYGHLNVKEMPYKHLYKLEAALVKRGKRQFARLSLIGGKGRRLTKEFDVTDRLKNNVSSQQYFDIRDILAYVRDKQGKAPTMLYDQKDVHYKDVNEICDRLLGRYKKAPLPPVTKTVRHLPSIRLPPAKKTRPIPIAR